MAAAKKMASKKAAPKKSGVSISKGAPVIHQHRNAKPKMVAC